MPRPYNPQKFYNNKQKLFVISRLNKNPLFTKNLKWWHTNTQGVRRPGFGWRRALMRLLKINRGQVVALLHASPEEFDHLVKRYKLVENKNREKRKYVRKQPS